MSPDQYLQRLQRAEVRILEPDAFFSLQSRILRHGGRVLPSRYGKVGGFKISLREGVRILREDAIVGEIDGAPLTVAEMAKLRLLQEIERGRRWRWKKEQRELLESEARIPQYVAPCRLEQGAYIDISGAYWTIYSRFLFADYFPGRYLLRPRLLPDFSDLQGEKAVRNAVFGLMRATKGIQFTLSGCRLVNIRNTLYHPSLCLLTYDILNAVALEMIQHAGAVYVNTDGYIVPVHRLPTAVEILESWGFRWKVEAQGETHVVAVGCYRVGEKVSEPYRQHRIRRERAMFAVRCLSDPEWLKSRVALKNSEV